jgi:hypothetical protein
MKYFLLILDDFKILQSKIMRVVNISIPSNFYYQENLQKLMKWTVLIIFGSNSPRVNNPSQLLT